jgi:hypothetical protein
VEKNLLLLFSGVEEFPSSKSVQVLVQELIWKGFLVHLNANLGLDPAAILANA